MDPAKAHLVDGGTVILTEGLTREDYETVLDKLRREVTRSYVEMLQVCVCVCVCVCFKCVCWLCACLAPEREREREMGAVRARFQPSSTSSSIRQTLLLHPKTHTHIHSILQTALALRGGMIQALVESNKVLSHQHHTMAAASKKAAAAAAANGDSSGSSSNDVHNTSNTSTTAGGEGAGVPSPTHAGGGGGENGGGGAGGGKITPPCTVVKDFVDALTRFLVVDCDAIAVPLFLSVMGALAWQVGR